MLLTIDKTDIIKTSDYDRFYYMLFKQSKATDTQMMIYKSRGTILDRPAWREDTVTYQILDPLDEITL